MSTAAKAGMFSTMSTKFQVGTAALALATAATVTPVIAHAAPGFAPLPQLVGDSATAVISDPVITPSNKVAAAAADPTDPCSDATFKGACYVVAGTVEGVTMVVQGTLTVINSVVYVAIAGTGQLLKFIGEVLPGSLGDAFTNAGDGVLTVANNYAKNNHVGPYLNA